MTGQDLVALIGGVALLAIVIYGFRGSTRIRPNEDPPPDRTGGWQP